MTDYQRLGEWTLGEMLALESRILDGEPSSIEPIGILNTSQATMSTAPTLTIDELVDLFKQFPRRPRITFDGITFEPPPPRLNWTDPNPFIRIPIA